MCIVFVSLSMANVTGVTGVTVVTWMWEKEEEEFLRADGPTGQSKVVPEVLVEQKIKRKTQKKKLDPSSELPGPRSSLPVLGGGNT